MMGSRGSANGIECDAFSRYSRGILRWKRGELRLIKRQFWKRSRKQGEAEAHATALYRAASESSG